MEKNWALIFDMDGVLVDNNPFHKKAWKVFCQKYGFELSEEQYRNQIYGRTNRNVLESLFPDLLNKNDFLGYAEEKEQIYRQIYDPHIQPVRGLNHLLELLKDKDLKMAVATSAPTKNLDFVMKHLAIRDYFDLIVDESMVEKGKPDPEIYLTVSKKLVLPVERCLVIEDSLSGVQAALSAGMKVVGITTTHEPSELKHTHWVINDFENVNHHCLKKLIENLP